MSAKCLIIESCEAHYANPVDVTAGETLVLSGRKDIWEGHVWLWAKSTRDGREGWVPDSLIVTGSNGEVTSAADYSAKELTCSKGEQVVKLHATHGWTLCQAANGEQGWVPDHCLQPL